MWIIWGVERGDEYKQDICILKGRLYKIYANQFENLIENGRIPRKEISYLKLT